MPNIASAFLPPSPLLIPEIGKQNYNILQKTIQAYQSVADILKKEETEIIIIISPHGQSQNNNISLNISPQLNLSFKEFGYLATTRSFSSALSLADEIKKQMGREDPVRFVSQDQLDYGSAVPLQLLSNDLKNIKVLPLFPAEKKDRKYHYQFGQKLGAIIRNRPEKIAIIAAGDLSHRLKKSSAAGYSPKGARFDNRLIAYLNDSENGINKILAMDEKIAEEALESGLKQLSLILGIIGENCQPQILSYQNDFGVGYLSVNFNLRMALI
jgi:aromatic ring-opening dioxygenase LigB subunit